MKEAEAAPLLWPLCLLFGLVLSPLGPHGAFVHCTLVWNESLPPTEWSLMYATALDLRTCHVSSRPQYSYRPLV